MGQQDRRSNALVKWVTIVGGVFALLGAIVGGSITIGEHLNADKEQDSRISRLEERVRDLERAERYLHGDQGLLPNAPKGKP